MSRIYPLGVYSFFGVPNDVIKNSVAGIELAVRASETQELKTGEKTDSYEHVEPTDEGRLNGYDKQGRLRK